MLHDGNVITVIDSSVTASTQSDGGRTKEKCITTSYSKISQNYYPMRLLTDAEEV